MQSLETFIVDSGTWTHADRVKACRLILQTLQGSAHQYETEVPSTHPDWPPEVVAAAEILRGVAARTERGGYAQTGVISTDREEVWSTFVDLAPWAYDATVWDIAGQDIVSLSDEAQSVVVRLNRPQYDTIASALGDTRLIPKRQWHGLSKGRCDQL